MLSFYQSFVQSFPLRFFPQCHCTPYREFFPPHSPLGPFGCPQLFSPPPGNRFLLDATALRDDFHVNRSDEGDTFTSPVEFSNASVFSVHSIFSQKADFIVCLPLLKVLDPEPGLRWSIWLWQESAGTRLPQQHGFPINSGSFFSPLLKI